MAYRMVPRGLVILVVALLLGFSGMAGATAHQPVEGAPLLAAKTATIQLTQSHEHPSGSVRLTGHGFAAGELVRISFAGVVQRRVRADAAGWFATHVAVPAPTVYGYYPVSARGTASGRSASARLLVSAYWSELNGDARDDNFSQYENVLGAENSIGLKQSWHIGTDRTPPVVAGNGMLYDFSPQENLEARDSRTGRLIWSQSPWGDFPISMMVADGRIVIDWDIEEGCCGFEDTEVRDGLTGAHLLDLTGGLRGIAHGVVYLDDEVCDSGGCYYGFVIGDRLSDGRPLWSIRGCANSAAILSEGVLVFAQTHPDICGNVPDLRGVNPLTGSSLWSVADDHLPVAEDSATGRIIAESRTDTEAIDPRTGQVLWHGTAASQPLYGGFTAAVGDGVVYIGCGSTSVCALSVDDGHLVGTASLAQVCTGFSGPYGLTLGNGVLYVVGGRCGVVAVDTATMSPSGLATALSTDEVVVVVNGMLYVTSTDGLTALAPR